MPRYSIVMPTYNRGQLLRHSLPTALEQSFDDFEVIVSNNCSTDETAEILAEFDDPRLRVVKPDERLSMVDHWEFALGHATGEWSLLLCDDDALLPNCLASLETTIREADDPKLIQYDRLCYVYGDGIREDGNYVEVGSKVRSGVIELDSARRLDAVFWRMSIELPKMLNCTVHRSVLDALKARWGRIFGVWAPDIWVGVKLLSHVPRYLKTGPLMLWGETMQSYGSGATRDPAHMLRFYKQFPEFEGTLPLCPYPEILTVNNCIFDTLARLKQQDPEGLAPYEIDPIRYRTRMLEDVTVYTDAGHEDYLPHKARLEKDLAEHKRTNRLGHGLRHLSNRANALPEKFARAAAGSRSKGPKKKHRFDNIADAARYVGTLL